MGRFLFYNLKRTLLFLATCTSIIAYFTLFVFYLNIADNSPTMLKRQAHIFDNLCKFLWTEPLDSTLGKRLQFPKTVHCAQKNARIFNRIKETGEFITIDNNLTNNLTCVVTELTGGLYPAAHRFKIGNNETFIPTKNTTFWINADNFLIQCFNESSKIFSRQFMGLKMFQTLGLVRRDPFPKQHPSSSSSSNFSLSILVFDSTSRAQFGRHMRATKRLITDMGGVIFEAYNKVGDNSAVNIVPVLAGELEETAKFPKLDQDGDINLNKILPYQHKLNPDTIRWIWKELPASGYVTMFNDDIMHTARGLFHYPRGNFRMGFAKKPATFYYRPYYNHLYKELGNFWKKCLDDHLLAEEFIDPWFRFESVFANVPHFGFSFIASLTHDDPNNLNLLDEIVFKKLAALNETGKLSNTFLVIMGDHGNRVHPLNRYTFAGKIEERAPFLSIIAPPTFREKFPEKYGTLRDNSQRFVSNFDLHETLREILALEKRPTSRGTSLFTSQDISKTCQDNNVISNHCLCMVDATSDLNKPAPIKKLEKALQNYIERSRLDNCFLIYTVKCAPDIQYLMPNNYVQVWARTKISDKEVERLKKNNKSPIIYAHSNCSAQSAYRVNISLETQFRIVQDAQSIKIVFPPKVTPIGVSNNCSYFTFPEDYCKCLGLLHENQYK